jgi:hypothetical protein
MCYVHQVLKICSFCEHDTFLTFDHFSVIYLTSLVMSKSILFVWISSILVVYLRLGLVLPSHPFFTNMFNLSRWASFAWINFSILAMLVTQAYTSTLNILSIIHLWRHWSQELL